MLKTLKPNEVVTSETVKDKVVKDKTQAAGAKDSVPPGAVNKGVTYSQRAK